MELLSKLGINWQLMIAQIVNFAVVLGLLTWAVYRPLLDLLDRRTDRIRKAMDDAKRLEAETRALDQKRTETLKKIDEEAGHLLADARKRAEAIRAEAVEKAHAEAEHILEKGRQALAAERDAALHDIQDTVASVVVTLTQKLLEREFSASDQKKFIDDAKSSLPALLK